MRLRVSGRDLAHRRRRGDLVDAPGSCSSTAFVDPQFNGRSAEASAIEAFATTADWDFIVGQAICAD